MREGSVILIIGGSGHLGRAVATRLLGQGEGVRIMTRNPGAAADLEEAGAQLVKGDLRDPASVLRACDGVEVVVAAAHAFAGRDDNNLLTVDDAGNRHLVDAARNAGVKHLTFTSIAHAAPDAALEYWRIKYGIEEYIRASSLDYTIIRPTAFMDLWGLRIGQPILKAGKATIFGRGNNPINLVAADDVAQFVCAGLRNPLARNRVIEVGGPENLTLNQVADILQCVIGRRARVRHVPLPLMRAMSNFLQPVQPTVSRLIRTSILMDTADLRFTMAETLNSFPLPITRFEDWAREHFDRAEAGRAAGGSQLGPIPPGTSDTS
jgi:uncharacterized protein YbjT (DUF2867 family)